MRSFKSLYSLATTRSNNNHSGFAPNTLALISGALFLIPVVFFLLVTAFDGNSSIKSGQLIKEYELAKQSGGGLDACIGAAIVANQYLRNLDQQNYRIWRKIQYVECQVFDKGI